MVYNIVLACCVCVCVCFFFLIPKISIIDLKVILEVLAHSWLLLPGKWLPGSFCFCSLCFYCAHFTLSQKCGVIKFSVSRTLTFWWAGTLRPLYTWMSACGMLGCLPSTFETAVGSSSQAFSLGVVLFHFFGKNVGIQV